MYKCDFPKSVGSDRCFRCHEISFNILQCYFFHPLLTLSLWLSFLRIFRAACILPVLSVCGVFAVPFCVYSAQNSGADWNKQFWCAFYIIAIRHSNRYTTERVIDSWCIFYGKRTLLHINSKAIDKEEYGMHLESGRWISDTNWNPDANCDVFVS